MKLVRPNGILSGYWIEGPIKGVPQVYCLGEHWTRDGWFVGPHEHRGYELFYQSAGSSIWSHAQGESEVMEGQGYLVQPGVRHQSVRFSKEVQHFYFLEFDLDGFVQESSYLSNLPLFSVFNESGDIDSLFRVLLRESAREDRFSISSFKSLLQLVANCLLRIYEDVDSERAKDSSEGCLHSTPEVHHARMLLENNIGQNWRLDELAKIVGLSPSYLSTCFKKAYGTSPMRYLDSCRIAKAKILLTNANLRITEIAHRLNYSSSQHLATNFKNSVGLSPRDYREKYDI